MGVVVLRSPTDYARSENKMRKYNSAFKVDVSAHMLHITNGHTKLLWVTGFLNKIYIFIYL